MKRSLNALILTSFICLPFAAHAVCVLGIGDCGGAFTAASYPDCSKLILKGAKGVPDAAVRGYEFTGTCRPKHDSLIVPAKVEAIWDSAKHQARETINITGFGGGIVAGVFSCEDDPFISKAACSVVQQSNTTEFDFFSNYLHEKHVPLTHNRATLAQANELSKKKTAAAPPPPPPNPKQGAAKPSGTISASHNTGVMKVGKVKLPEVDLTISYAKGMIYNKCRADQPVLKVGVTVKNIGGLASKSLGNQEMLVIKELGGTNMSAWSGLNSVAPGGTRQEMVYISYPHPLSALAGHHNFRIFLNPYTKVSESNLANNTYEFSVNFPRDYCKSNAVRRMQPGADIRGSAQYQKSGRLSLPVRR